MTALVTTPVRRLRREVPSRLRAVEAVCREVRALLREHGLEAAIFAVELSARECLNNAVLHGNRGQATRRVALEMWIGRIWIRLQVTDQGKGFNWRQARIESAREGSPHGRGLAICALYAYRVAFNRRGNRITLWLAKPKTDH